jgi:hypothetical protein
MTSESGGVADPDTPQTAEHDAPAPSGAEPVAKRAHRFLVPVLLVLATVIGIPAAFAVFRYSSERNSRTLFYTSDVPTLRKLHPERQQFKEWSDDARLIVSEPLEDVAGVWNEVPESTGGIIGPGRAELRAFRPAAPSASPPVAG